MPVTKIYLYRRHHCNSFLHCFRAKIAKHTKLHSKGEYNYSYDLQAITIL